jgi:hypothetical protein
VTFEVEEDCTAKMEAQLDYYFTRKAQECVSVVREANGSYLGR